MSSKCLSVLDKTSCESAICPCASPFTVPSVFDVIFYFMMSVAFHCVAVPRNLSQVSVGPKQTCLHITCVLLRLSQGVSQDPSDRLHQRNPPSDAHGERLGDGHHHACHCGGHFCYRAYSLSILQL